MNKTLLCVCVLLCFVLGTSSESVNSLSRKTKAKTGKFLGLFSIVSFNRHTCNDTDSDDQGVCLSRGECRKAGGTSLRFCAAGFGVCCQIVKNTCGSTVNTNCTFIRNPNFPGNENGNQQCSYTINKCATNICYYRLEMVKNSIAPQDTTSTDSSVRGMCTSDTMTTTCSTGTSMPDNFCGNNDGQHVYLDVSTVDSCTITFNLGDGATTERAWDIKVNQIECNSVLAPPAGCLQYYWGTTGTLCSFSYLDSITHSHLSNNMYSICVRPEAGFCQIAYTENADVSYPFRISDPESSAGVGSENCQTDLITIPLGVGTNDAATFINSYCGEKLAATQGSTTTETITSSLRPFILGVNFDSTETNTDNNGFKLDYQQLAC